MNNNATQVTEEEFQDSLRNLQGLWDAKADLERRLGDEKRRVEKLRDHVSEQVAARDKLKEQLEANNCAQEQLAKRAERDRGTIEGLERRLEEAQRRAGERSCGGCAELEAQAAALARENAQLKAAASELDAVRAYGMELQGVDSASQMPSLAARRASGERGLGRSTTPGLAAGGRAAGAAAGSPGDSDGSSRLKLSKKHRSDQFSSLGTSSQHQQTAAAEDEEDQIPTSRFSTLGADDRDDRPAAAVPRFTRVRSRDPTEAQAAAAAAPASVDTSQWKKRCVSPTFDETEQQSQSQSQSSQPSQTLGGGLGNDDTRTPALYGEEDDMDDAQTSHWDDGDSHVPPQQLSPLQRQGSPVSLPSETQGEEDSMAGLLDDCMQPSGPQQQQQPAAQSSSRRRSPTEKENALPSANRFNVSTPETGPVDHGRDERRAATSPAAVADSAASSVVTLSTTQTQHSEDLFPDSDNEDPCANRPDGEAGGARGGFKVKPRKRTPFTQSQRS